MDFSLLLSLPPRPSDHEREERGQCDFFTFRVKRENFVAVLFPRDSFCLGKEESGDSLHVREFHCKRNHPNSVGYLGAVGMDLQGIF